MRRQGNLWEYIATYVDDLLIVSHQPLKILKVLQSNPCNFKSKGSGPISFHLGCGFTRDNHNVLCIDPKKYIEKMVQSYEQIFGTKLGKKPYSRLEEGDHPELDASSFLSEEAIMKYQSLIGQL